jgi:DeoR family glycerol-3-phosphate regulon repressor
VILALWRGPRAYRYGEITRRAGRVCQPNFWIYVDDLPDCLIFWQDSVTSSNEIHSAKGPDRAMLTKRHGAILQLLQDQGAQPLAALAAALEVSAETVRRDVRAMVEAGAVVRVHGAVGLAGQTGEAPFDRRMRENAGAKRAIARAMAEEIADGDSLMLDTGTTTSFLARELLTHRRLTVVTNSSDIARTLATVNGNRVFMAGGELRGDSGASLGASALEFVRAFAVQHAIISAGAVDASGVMDYDLQEAEFARAVLACGERRVMVTDASKFGRRGFIRVSGFEHLDLVVTDAPPPAAVGAAMASAGVGLKLAL